MGRFKYSHATEFAFLGILTNASKMQSKRVKWNIVKTMIIVSVAFVFCWFPNSFYFIIVDNTTQTSSNMFAGYYSTLFLAYFYICMNPFIYAIKHEGVKEKLTHLMVWRRRGGVAAISDTPQGNINTRIVAVGTQQTPADTAQPR